MATPKTPLKKASKRSPGTASSSPAKKQGRFKRWLGRLDARRTGFLAKRPHRSFRRTRRRDYKRSLKLPGYWALTTQIFSVLLKNRRIFLGLAVIYFVLMVLVASIMSQETYLQLRAVVDEAADEGLWSGSMSVITLFWGVFSSQIAGGAGGAVGSSEQIFGALLGLLAWLTTVWLLRSLLAGQKPRIRDGLYSSGGPIIALLILVFVLLIQLIPAAVAVIAYGAADTSGLLDQTAMLMLFGGGAILLVTLSLYWAVSTLIAMVVVTLPGMYPMQALKLAGDIVVGRRIRIVLRLSWSALLLLLIWLVVLVPVILLEGALRASFAGVEWLPLVPVVALLLGAFSIIFMAAYIYLFYRKVVEDDSAPA